MSKSWPMVKLGDVLTPVSRPVNVQADEHERLDENAKRYLVGRRLFATAMPSGLQYAGGTPAPVRAHIHEINQ